jgi:hypothetical protein
MFAPVRKSRISRSFSLAAASAATRTTSATPTASSSSSSSHPAPHPAPFKDIEERVEKDYRLQKGMDLALEIAAGAQKSASIEAAATAVDEEIAKLLTN